MKENKLPSDFDYSKKGYLFYEEYLGFIAYKKETPLNKSHFKEIIKYDECISKEKRIINEDIFNILSNNKKYIDKSSLLNACDKLSIEPKGIDFNEILSYFDDEEKISYDKFKEIF